MNNFVFSVENYILYLLQKMEPEKSDKIRLNKIAFFVEFGYYFKKQRGLSKADYAGITLGPVINDYAKILQDMQNKHLIILDNNHILPLKSVSVDIPEEVKVIIDPLIEKYKKFGKEELITLSHLTDSFKITTRNEKEWGNIIDKNLASLETFFEDSDNYEIDEKSLPTVYAEKLEPYEMGQNL